MFLFNVAIKGEHVRFPRRFLLLDFAIWPNLVAGLATQFICRQALSQDQVGQWCHTIYVSEHVGIVLVHQYRLQKRQQKYIGLIILSECDLTQLELLGFAIQLLNNRWDGL